MAPSPHLSPSETARRFGISIKALRLYERRGLLNPLRSEAGWRTYGPDQIARLHQILALKRLGLSLGRITTLLKSADALEPVLALQEEALARDSERLSRALLLVRAALKALTEACAHRHFTPQEMARMQQYASHENLGPDAASDGFHETRPGHAERTGLTAVELVFAKQPASSKKSLES